MNFLIHSFEIYTERIREAFKGIKTQLRILSVSTNMPQSNHGGKLGGFVIVNGGVLLWAENNGF